MKKVLTFWNPKDNYGAHTSLPLVIILSQLNPVHILPPEPLDTFKYCSPIYDCTHNWALFSGSSSSSYSHHEDRLG
jgi:hypothetical protein